MRAALYRESGLVHCIASDTVIDSLKNKPNIMHAGFIDDFAAIRRLMGRSKIVLNVTAKFPRGSHERIWSGMAEGAVVLTDRTSLLQQDFAEGESIHYLPQHRLSPSGLAFLGPLLRNSAKLQSTADHARERYQAKHIWRRRAEPMLRALQMADRCSA